MAKIIVFNLITIDGYFCGPNGEINWHNVDKEFNEFAVKQTGEAGTLIFGKTTYQLMANYWPSGQAVKNDPLVASLMNNTPKLVFSKTMDKADWENTQVLKQINKPEIEQLKQAAKKDLFIFGSGQIVQEFTKLGLIDEYRLMVNPVTLGKGKPLFQQALKLKLVSSREFKNGNVLLCYKN